MKRLAFIMTALLLALMPASAQHYRDSRYYNKHTGRLDYGYNHHGYGVPYYGLRIGPSFSYVNSDDERLDGGNWQTDSTLALWLAFRSPTQPHSILKRDCRI